MAFLCICSSCRTKNICDTCVECLYYRECRHFFSFSSNQGTCTLSFRNMKYSPIHSTELPYNSDLKERARELRKAGNLPEVVFWKVVKNKQIFGLDFDRQKIIGNFIVDFYCTKLALIIEIDGSSHDEKYEYDMEREVYLRSLGLKILRFTVRDVMDNLSWVVEYLKEYILREYP